MCGVYVSVRVRVRACVWRVIVCVCVLAPRRDTGEHICVLEAERARHALLAFFLAIYIIIHGVYVSISALEIVILRARE